MTIGEDYVHHEVFKARTFEEILDMYNAFIKEYDVVPIGFYRHILKKKIN